MFVVESLLRQLTEQKVTVLSSYGQLCGDLKSSSTKSPVQCLQDKQRLFRVPLLKAIKNCQSKSWTVDDLKIILLAFDHFMFKAEFEPIQEIDWLSIAAMLADKCEEDSIRGLLLRLFRFFENCNLVSGSEQVPLLLLNSIIKDLESPCQERIIWALKIAKYYCLNEDSKSILIPKLFPLLSTARINDACKAMVIKVLAAYNCKAELFQSKLPETMAPSLQCAIKLHYPDVKLESKNAQSSSAVINLVLESRK